MAKLKLFTVYDSAVEAYNQPFYARALGEALRIWEKTCNDPQHPFSQTPQDFTLFEIGEFDDKTAHIEMLSVPKPLGNAIEAKKAREAEIRQIS